jgi:hypothetical protein
MRLNVQPENIQWVPAPVVPPPPDGEGGHHLARRKGAAVQMSKTRYTLLVRLAWELREVPLTSLLVLPGHGEAVLWVSGRDGRKEPVLAVPRPDRWRLLWRGTELDAESTPDAARRIAATVTA